MKLPEIWPGAPPAVEEDSPVSGPERLSYLGEVAAALAAVTYDLCDRGIGWLERMLRRPTLRCKMVVVVYPACATRQEHLEALAELSDQLEGRLAVRIFPESTNAGLLTVMTFVRFAQPTVMLIGGAGDLGVDPETAGLANMLYEPRPLELDRWCEWFDDLWRRSASLCPETIRIPRLVPAQGSPKAQKLWEDYVGTCFANVLQRSEERVDEEREDRPGTLTGQKQAPVPVRSSVGEESATATRPGSSPTGELGLPRLGQLERRLVELYEKGMLVAIDKYSRTPPVDVPVKPEWLGVDRLRRVGAASRRVEYRVSVFDEADLRRLQAWKDKTRELLSKFSYALADGQRWMPHSARELFKRALDAANAEAVEGVNMIIKGDMDGFLKKRQEVVVRDLEVLYQEYHPGKSLPRDVIDNVLEELRKRIEGLCRERFLPQVTYARVSFEPASGEGWQSAWGQALRLLHSIAEYPRKAITDRFFFRGFPATISIGLDELLQAMDVCNDVVVREVLSSRYVTRDLEVRALNELKRLNAIMGSDKLDAREKCQEILRIIRGEG